MGVWSHDYIYTTGVWSHDYIYTTGVWSHDYIYTTGVWSHDYIYTMGVWSHDHIYTTVTVFTLFRSPDTYSASITSHSRPHSILGTWGDVGVFPWVFTSSLLINKFLQVLNNIMTLISLLYVYLFRNILLLLFLFPLYLCRHRCWQPSPIPPVCGDRPAMAWTRSARYLSRR